jgi:hypothetical protein
VTGRKVEWGCSERQPVLRIDSDLWQASDLRRRTVAVGSLEWPQTSLSKSSFRNREGLSVSRLSGMVVWPDVRGTQLVGEKNCPSARDGRQPSEVGRREEGQDRQADLDWEGRQKIYGR